MEQTAQNSLKLTSLLLSLLSALVVGYDSDYFSKIKILLKPILLLSVLSIIELYNYESRGGFVGRNNNKFFLTSSRTRVTDTLRYQMRSQSNNLNVQIMTMRRLPAVVGHSTVPDESLITPLMGPTVESSALSINNTSQQSKWFDDLETKAGYKFRPLDFDYVAEDSLVRTMKSAKTLAVLQIQRIDSKMAGMLPPNIKELSNCSSLPNSTYLCFDSYRRIAVTPGHNAFALTHIMQNISLNDEQEEGQVSTSL